MYTTMVTSLSVFIQCKVKIGRKLIRVKTNSSNCLLIK